MLERLKNLKNTIENRRKEKRPLGVRDDFPLTESQMRQFQALQDYDLGHVRNRLINFRVVPRQIIDEAIFEFRRYMGLYLVQKDSVTMFSTAVDEVWHATILHTRLYQDFCHNVFGEFLHHDPFEGGDPNPQSSWEKFDKIYQLVYGDLGKLWQLARPKSK